MMQRPRLLLLLCALVLHACTTGPEAPVPQPGRTKPAIGQVTMIDRANAPDTVPLLPVATVPAPVFTPVGDGPMAHVRTFTTDDGLPMDDILCTYLDANGMLWIGSNGGGITRYDGRSFVTFSTTHGLPDNVILSIGGDRSGNLWIGTSTGGLCRYDGHVFAPMPIGEETPADGLARGITAMVEDRHGALWFASRGRGLHRFDGTRFTSLTTADGLPSDFIHDLAITADGTLWMSTPNGLCSYRNNTFTTIARDGAVDLTKADIVTSDGGDGLWVGRRNEGLSHLRHTGDTVRFAHASLDLVEDGDIYDIGLDRSGDAWIATTTSGVLRTRLEGEAIVVEQRITHKQGFPTDEVLSASPGGSGDMWFGTRGGGLCHLRSMAFSAWLGVKPVGLALDGNQVLHIGTPGGLARIGPNGLETTTTPDAERWYYSMSTDPLGRIVFGVDLDDPSTAGFTRLVGDRGEVVGAKDTVPRRDVFFTLHDRHGRIWLGTRRGAERYGDGQRITYDTRHGIGNNNVLCLLEGSNGAIWIGTDGGGLSRLDDHSCTTWTTAGGLPNNVIWSIAEESPGILWISTLGGLYRFDGKSFLPFTTHHGLPEDNVYQVLPTKRGGLAIGTLNGLAILTGWRQGDGPTVPFHGSLTGASNQDLERHTPVFEVYNSVTGYPVKDVMTAEHTILEDPNGVLWISCGSDKARLIRFDRAAMQVDTMHRPVQLLGVDLHNEPVCWYDLASTPMDSATLAQHEVRTFGNALGHEQRDALRSRFSGVHFDSIMPHLPVPTGLVLDHANNQIGFRFSYPETANPELVEYMYKLDGYDAHWSGPTRIPSASFGNIHEGRYTFLLKARNPAGVWGPVREYRFTVLPPMHRSWWAYLLYVLLMGGGVVAYIRLRIASLKRRQQVLVRLVDERTEELRHKKEEADEQRERAEFSEQAKAQFLANMSHEIRTPMNAIMGMSEILRNREHSPEQARFLHAIAQSSENLLVIVNDILDLSKVNAGRIVFEQVPFEPRQVLNNVREVLLFKAQEKGLSVLVDVALDVPETLYGDPTRLNQVIMNLGGNALKFTEQGSVTIRASATADVQGRSQWVALVVEVIDTGIGIPEDRLERIFDEFTQAYSDTTRKYGGTGLGLTISKRFAEAQGGSVTVQSVRGKGSTFRVVVPYNTKQ